MQIWRFKSPLGRILLNIVLIGWAAFMLSHTENGLNERNIFITLALIWLIVCFIRWLKIAFYAYQNQEFFQLTPAYIQYNLYPEQGKLPIEWIKYVKTHIHYSRGFAIGGEIVLEYLRPEDAPDTADLRQLKLDVSRIISPNPKHWFRQDKNLEETLLDFFQQLKKHFSENQLYTWIEREQLRARNDIERSKQETREWLAKFK